MSAFINDRFQIETEVLNVSSVNTPSQYSQRYDMSMCDKISFIVTNGTAQTGIAAMPTVTFYASTSLTGAGTAISSATCDFCNATANVITKANAIIIDMVTAASWTLNDPYLTLNDVTVRGSTALTGTTWATGATVTFAVGGCSADMSSAAAALVNLINNSSLWPNLYALTTNNSSITPGVKVMVKDGISTYISAQTTGTELTLKSAIQQSVFDFDVDMLAGNRYIWAKLTTLATAVSVALTCIKDGKGHLPVNTTAHYLVQYKSS